MLKNILAVITASVSFAGCETGPVEEPKGRRPQIFNRPIAAKRLGGSQISNGLPNGQSGSAAATGTGAAGAS